MHYHIYLPVNVARKKFTKAVLVGHEIENAIVVVQFFAELPKNLAGLSVVAGLNKSVEGRPLLVYDENLGRHFVEEDGHTYTVVTFAPPNLRNLEYFTVDAILLQSTGKVEKSSPAETSIAQSVSMLPTKSSLEEGCAVFGENVLEKINSCQSDRDTLDRLNKRSWRLPSTPTLSWVPSQLVFLLHFLIFCMISILTFCINCLNHTVLGMSLVERLAFLNSLISACARWRISPPSSCSIGIRPFSPTLVQIGPKSCSFPSTTKSTTSTTLTTSTFTTPSGSLSTICSSGSLCTTHLRKIESFC